MDIYLWSFQKRKNSTKVPASAGTKVECYLKEETSIMNPSFIINAASLSGYNYLQWDTNYYFISDIVSIRKDVWRIDCDMDVLATFSAQIKSTTAFIEYADSYDARIYDPRLAKKINATETSNTVSAPYVDTTGYYVVTVIGEDTCGIYKMNILEVESLMQNCTQWWNNFDTSSWASVEDSIKI